MPLDAEIIIVRTNADPFNLTLEGFAVTGN
jgi:hypothetical protein